MNKNLAFCLAILTPIKWRGQQRRSHLCTRQRKVIRERKKGEKERKRETKEKPKKTKEEKKRKERKRGGGTTAAREKEREESRQQGRRRERSHGSKEKERKSPASRHGQLRTAVAVTVVGNAVSRQNYPFSLLSNITSKTFFLMILNVFMALLWGTK